MIVNFSRPQPKYDQNDEAQFRRALEQALGSLATLNQAGADPAMIFASLPDPTKVPVGTRRFVTDRGSHGKPLWSYASGWVDGTGTVVT